MIRAQHREVTQGCFPSAVTEGVRPSRRSALQPPNSPPPRAPGAERGSDRPAAAGPAAPRAELQPSPPYRGAGSRRDEGPPQAADGSEGRHGTRRPFPRARRGRFQKVRARDPRRRSATPGARAVRAVRCGAVLRGAARSRPGAPRQERRLLRLEAQRPTPRATEGVHPVCPRRFCSSRYQTAGPAVLTLALFAKLWFASEPERRL